MAAGSVKVMRDTSERRRKITAMLRTRGSVQVTPLAEQFGVSMQTIRKDLHYLEERGVAMRAYGGARSAEPSQSQRRRASSQPEGRRPQCDHSVALLFTGPI